MRLGKWNEPRFRLAHHPRSSHLSRIACSNRHTLTGNGQLHMPRSARAPFPGAASARLQSTIVYTLYIHGALHPKHLADTNSNTKHQIPNYKLPNAYFLISNFLFLIPIQSTERRAYELHDPIPKRQRVGTPRGWARAASRVSKRRERERLSGKRRESLSGKMREVCDK